jgi:curved DNA-binding protein CbpA
VSGVAEPALRDDPFAALGLPARAGLSDEDVRAAWRRIAAATHPDREDGGDPARFGAAAAAYAQLRTTFWRGEALADLGLSPGPVRRPGRHRGHRGRAAAGLAGRAARLTASRSGWGLAARAAVAGAVGAVAFFAAGWSPGTAGVLAGALTWVLIAGLRA